MLAETAIANLIYTYAERIDAGDFPGAAALFDSAAIKLAEGHETDAAGLLAIWRARIVVHPCGTPRTKHVITTRPRARPPAVRIIRCCNRPVPGRCR